MGNAQVDYSAVRGNLKDVFAAYENACPKELLLMRDFSFDSGEKAGDDYILGVELARPQGFTTAAPGVFPALNAAVSRVAMKARLQPYQMYLRERITYDVLTRAAESRMAARTELGATIEAMRDSIMFRQEVLALYGQQGLATIGTVTGDSASITSATWAPGMWAGTEGARLTARDSSGNFKTTVTINFVNFDNLTLQFNTGDGQLLAANQVLWFENSSSSTELVGVKAVLANTGTLYNINAAQFSLWKGVVYDMTVEQAGSDITLKHVLRLDARIRSRGGAGDQNGYVSPDGFTTLVNSIEAARTFGGSNQYSPTEITRGTQELCFYSPVGKTIIKPHPFVARGDFFSMRSDKWNRAGATDPTFNLPGQEQLGLELQDYPGRELRSLANNSWVSRRPASSGLIKNVTFGGTTT